MRRQAGPDSGAQELPVEVVWAHEARSTLEARVKNDPRRPRFHFLPPAGWMNDPNGTLWHGGFYHLFYQHNPYGDEWGRIHWGHARSVDLVHWEHLPIALAPVDELGEGSCFSGCCTISPLGAPTILYTKVGPEGDSAEWEQWAAISDEDMLVWRRDRGNPVLSVSSHGGPRILGNWRDPYIFHAGGRSFLVLGAELRDGGDYAVLLYESDNGDPLRWRYRGILIRRPRWEGAFFECPNFFELDGKWVLLVSPFAPVEFYSGEFDPERGRFTPLAHGTLDEGIDFYATNTAKAPDGRTILFGWVRGFRRGQGWNGCLALPREIALGGDGRLLQRPAREVDGLREAPLRRSSLRISTEATVIDTGAPLARAEISLGVRILASAGFELFLRGDAEGRSGLSLTYDGQYLDLFGLKFAYPLPSPGALLRLRLLVDGVVLELFVDEGKRAATKVVYGGETGSGLSLRTLGGEALLEELALFPLASAEG